MEMYMRTAQLEGRKALPDCLPNPPVGCVIVRGEAIIARGYTQAPGQPHAEALALSQLRGDETDLHVFVTLAPCSFQGRPPSCARAITRYDVATVYIGLIDPHPRNRGAGIDILKAANIPVVLDVLAEELREDLGPYLIHKTD